MSDKQKTKKYRLSVLLESPEYEALVKVCRKEDITMANYVRKALGWQEEMRGIPRDSRKDRMKTPEAVLQEG